MQITPMILAGSLAAIVATAGPAFAKNTQTPQTSRMDEQTASPAPCRAYQQAPDGSWTELPCQAQGQTASAPRRQQSVTNTPSSAAR